MTRALASNLKVTTLPLPESDWVMGTLAFGKVGLKPCVWCGEACIWVHKARTQLAIFKQFPNVNIHQAIKCKVEKKVYNAEQGIPFNSILSDVCQILHI